MSDSEGDFESADEDHPGGAAASKAPTTKAAAAAGVKGGADEPTLPSPVVVTSQPATSADVDATSPKIELSVSEGAGSGGGGAGGWTSWGLSWGQSLISGAKSGVSVLAKELGDGLGSVSRTVESVLDAPPPEELASSSDGVSGSVEPTEVGASAPPVAEADDGPEVGSAPPPAVGDAAGSSSGSGSGGGGSGSWFSGWRVGGSLTSVTQTGSYLVSGGLDLLEALGKRTMDALQETDPGFQRTKALLGRGRRPNLSELLREAQASGAAAAAAAANGPDGADVGIGADPDSPDFACQFDRLNGSAYLDGLQTLAGQCELRLQAKLSTRPEMRPAMAEILARLERVRDEEATAEAAGESRSLEAALAALPNQFAPANIWLTGAVAGWVYGINSQAGEDQKGMSVAAVQVDCVRRLAGLTAATLHYLVKAASLASAASAAGVAPPVESASRLVDLCFALIGCADGVREGACVRMQEAAAAAAAAEAEADGAIDEHEVNQAMTQAILEAEGAKAYLQDAFLLLAPVLQLAALDHQPTDTTAVAAS